MNLANLPSQAAGKPVKNTSGQWTFLPNNLPPPLSWTGELASKIEATTVALARLDGAMRFDAAGLPAKALASPLLKREAVLSSRIEQIQTTLTDLSAFQTSAGKVSNDAATSETANYLNALQAGLAHVASGRLSVSLIKALHQQLLTGVRGQEKTPGMFRTVQNFIGNRALAEARYIPPPPEHVGPLMDDLEKFMTTTGDMPAVVRMAICHYQFEAVHPFADGNGRVGRLLISLQLISYGLLAEPVLYASAYFERHRREYYDRLLAVSAEGQWDEWIAYFLDALRTESQDVLHRATLLATMRRGYLDTLSKARGSALSMKLLDYVMSQLTLTTKDATTFLGVTAASAQGHINKFIDLGILKEITGKAKDRVYLASEVIDLLNRDLQTPSQPVSSNG